MLKMHCILKNKGHLLCGGVLSCCKVPWHLSALIKEFMGTDAYFDVVSVRADVFF